MTNALRLWSQAPNSWVRPPFGSPGAGNPVCPQKRHNGGVYRQLSPVEEQQTISHHLEVPHQDIGGHSRPLLLGTHVQLLTPRENLATPTHSVSSLVMATNVEKTAAPALACGRGNQSRRSKSTRNMDESNHEIGLVGKLVKSTLTCSLRKNEHLFVRTLQKMGQYRLSASCCHPGATPTVGSSFCRTRDANFLPDFPTQQPQTLLAGNVVDTLPKRPHNNQHHRL